MKHLTALDGNNSDFHFHQILGIQDCNNIDYFSTPTRQHNIFLSSADALAQAISQGQANAAANAAAQAASQGGGEYCPSALLMSMLENAICCTTSADLCFPVYVVVFQSPCTSTCWFYAGNVHSIAQALAQAIAQADSVPAASQALGAVQNAGIQSVQVWTRFSPIIKISATY